MPKDINIMKIAEELNSGEENDISDQSSDDGNVPQLLTSNPEPAINLNYIINDLNNQNQIRVINDDELIVEDTIIEVPNYIENEDSENLLKLLKEWDLLVVYQMFKGKKSIF